MMRVAVGGSLMWRNREYTVLFIERDSATLRDEDGGEVEVAIDELGSDATPVSADTSGLLQLSLQVEDIEPGMDPCWQSMARLTRRRATGMQRPGYRRTRASGAPLSPVRSRSNQPTGSG